MTEEPLARLLRGNRRFVAQQALYPNQTTERRIQVEFVQVPFAVILGCSDSRVPLEIIFDQGIGDLFVVRVAGNVLDEIVLGSIEFAIEKFQSPLLMVLGHANCGAVGLTLDVLEHGTVVSGKMASLVEAIKPAVEPVKTLPGEWVTHAVRANVLHVVEQLKSARPIISRRYQENKLRIVGAEYAQATGLVRVLT